MHLNNFEEYIEDVIVGRGEEYFAEGHVSKIDEIDENKYVLDVLGSRTYTVEIYLGDTDEIIESYCDCPYDWGEYCKHLVAAFFALRQIRGKKQEVQTEQVYHSSKKESEHLANILSSLSKDELIQLLVGAAMEYKELKTGLMLKYASIQNEVLFCQKLIKQYINQYSRQGYIEWKDARKALRGADMTLTKAVEKLDNGETEQAVLLGLTVLPLVVDMLEFTDDSSGDVGFVIEQSLDLINQAVANGVGQWNAQQQEKLFIKIVEESQDERYEGWSDWQLSLLKICLHFSHDSGLRETLETQFELLIKNRSDDSLYNSYVRQNLKLLQLELIDRHDGVDQAIKFITENIQYSAFRERLIQLHLEKGDYREVIRLSIEGEKLDKQYRGQSSSWKKFKLQAYEKLGDIAKQKELLLEFLYQNEFDYYLQLKNLYHAEEWEEVLQDILTNLGKRKHPPSAYVDILIEEKLYAKLLRYCQRNPSTVEELYPYLNHEYADEVNDIYREYIYIRADEASNRNQYYQVCQRIKAYTKACGYKPALQAIDELTNRNKRRPAFVDELAKLKKQLSKG